MRGRRPAVPASAILDEVRTLIARAAGQPCPTNADIAKRLGLSVHAVHIALRELARLRQIRAQRTGQRGAYSRRVRVLIEGRWTEWTRWTERAKPQLDDHLARVLASGNYQNDSNYKYITCETL